MRTIPYIRASIFLIIAFFFNSAPANAWHIEYDVYNMYSEDNAAFNGGVVTKFQVSDDLPNPSNFFTSSWTVENVIENPDGSVDVTYNTVFGSGDGEDLEGEASFTIVSDYGNMASIAIDSILNELVVAEGDIFGNDIGDTLDSGTDSFAWIEHGIALANAGARDLSVESYGSDFREDYDDDTTLTLFTNIEYTFSSALYTEAWSELVGYLPETFINMDEYNDFIASNGEDALEEASGHAGMFWEIEIDGTETPVPEPASMFLFAIGIIGLAGSRVIKK